MEWLQLTVSIAQAVAWPLAVVVLVLVLRPHLLTLLERDRGRLIKRVKVGPVEAEWEADVREGAKEIEQDVEKKRCLLQSKHATAASSHCEGLPARCCANCLRRSRIPATEPYADIRRRQYRADAIRS